MMLPRWLVDDTAGIGDAQVFVAHTHEPFLFGEISFGGDGRVILGQIVAPLGDGRELVVLEVERSVGARDLSAMLPSLREALDAHDAVRGAKP